MGPDCRSVVVGRRGRCTDRQTILGSIFRESLEAHRNSDVARRFFDAGPGRVRQLLASLLTEAMARGEIAEGDAVQSAEDLMSLWLGFGMMQRRFVDCAKSTAMETESTVRRAVRLYLRGSLPATA